MLTTDVITRLAAQVSDLNGRTFGAADLTALVRKGRLPQHSPAAHVVPAGITAGKAAGLTGQYLQAIGHKIAVVVTLRNQQKVGKRGLDEVEALLEEVTLALVGWTPDPSTTGVFEFRGSKLLSMAGDGLVYQLDFVLPDHMRITP